MELSDVEKVLDKSVRPQLLLDGGGITISDYTPENGTLYVRLTGMCSGCASADETVKTFIEAVLCSALPEIKAVELEEGVSPELMDFAKRLLNHEIV